MFPISISPEEIAKLELVSFPGEIVLVDSLNDTFYAALRYLRRQKVLGFDTETRPPLPRISIPTVRRSCNSPVPAGHTFSVCRKQAFPGALPPYLRILQS